jgi:hypothetical protein
MDGRTESTELLRWAGSGAVPTGVADETDMMHAAATAMTRTTVSFNGDERDMLLRPGGVCGGERLQMCLLFCILQVGDVGLIVNCNCDG